MRPDSCCAGKRGPAQALRSRIYSVRHACGESVPCSMTVPLSSGERKATERLRLCVICSASVRTEQDKVAGRRMRQQAGFLRPCTVRRSWAIGNTPQALCLMLLAALLRYPGSATADLGKAVPATSAMAELPMSAPPISSTPTEEDCASYSAQGQSRCCAESQVESFGPLQTRPSESGALHLSCLTMTNNDPTMTNRRFYIPQTRPACSSTGGTPSSPLSFGPRSPSGGIRQRSAANGKASNAAGAGSPTCALPPSPHPHLPVPTRIASYRVAYLAIYLPT